MTSTKPTTSGAEGKYTIYSSDAKKDASDDAFVLPKDTPIDSLVSTIESKSITLSEKPTADKDTPFDASDKWAEFLLKVDEKGTYSLILDPTASEKKEALKSFQFKFTEPWPLTFSSTPKDLESSFGDAASSIDVPGVDGSPKLYCGLVEPDAAIKTTVKGVLEYVGLPSLAKGLPSLVPDFAITLAPGKIAGKRNAMWFDPSSSLQTTIRLQFELDIKDDLENLLNKAISGFKIKEAAVIARKVVTEGVTADGSTAVNEGSMIFETECTASTKNNDVTFGMKAGIEWNMSSVDLKLKMEEPDVLSRVLKWLGELISVDLDFITSLFGDGKAFQNLSLQQVAISLSTKDKEKPTLESFRIDIEVAGNFGQVQNKKPVFLASFSWRKGNKMGTSIRAQLWTSFDTDEGRVLQPEHEDYQDLIPFTSGPGTAINLETLIPGQKIDIPKRVPSNITRAFAVLAKGGVSFGATIETKEDVTAGDVPQPYLGKVNLDASYEWGKESKFEFDLGILAGIEPSKSSTHKKPALLEGELSFKREDEKGGDDEGGDDEGGDDEGGDDKGDDEEKDDEDRKE